MRVSRYSQDENLLKIAGDKSEEKVLKIQLFFVNVSYLIHLNIFQSRTFSNWYNCLRSSCLFL